MEGIATGIVKENWNSDFPGRIRVEYRAGEEGKTLTNWIPMMTPYAGKGYGEYFLPEVGSEVALGFVHGDASMPIVLGCLWGEINELPQDIADQDNTKKLIETKEGFRFCAGEKLLTMSDKEKENTMTLDTENGIITLDIKKSWALKIDGEDFLTVEKGKVTFAKDVEIKGGKISVTGDEGISMHGEKLELKPDKETVIGGSKVEINPSQSVKIGGGELNISPAKSVKVKSQQVNAQAAIMELKSDVSGKVNSSGMLELKGTVVKIN